MLVFGPESSGTRLVTEALIASGCDGDSTHEQRWDIQPLPDHDCVWRRSLPHGGNWPNLSKIVQTVRAAGHTPLVVVTIREHRAMITSQYIAGHVSTVEQAVQNVQRAMCEIYSCIMTEHLAYCVIPFEACVLHGRETFRALALWAGLNADADFPVTSDQNLKHYK